VIGLARRLLSALLPPDVRAAVLTELDAEYGRVIRPARGGLRAAAWYWRQVAGSIGPAVSMRRRRRACDRASLMAIVMRALAEAGQDARFAGRLLVRQKGFTAAAIATLALGIGATTAIFSLVDGVLLRPLPYRDPSRLVRVWSANPRGIPKNGISPADYFDWREQVQDVEALAAFDATNVTLTGAGDPVQLAAAISLGWCTGLRRGIPRH
jgi:MacB-like periplasmic core domain